MTHRIVVFRDVQGQWRWHLKAPNGRIVADSGEGYKRHYGASQAAARIAALMPTVRIEDKP